MPRDDDDLIRLRHLLFGARPSPRRIDHLAAIEQPPPSTKHDTFITSAQGELALDFPVLEPMIRARANVGFERYGTFLSLEENGRDPEVDCLQEVLDAAIYARQAQARARREGDLAREDVWRSRTKRLAMMALLIGGVS